jgi:NCS1 family nucleobase:cation symporter-1
MFADYFIIRRTRLRLSHLYVPDQSSIYWYTHGLSSFLALPRPGAEVYRASSYMAPLFFFFLSGLNFRAPVVWVLSVFPSLPGFAYTLSKGKLNIPIGWVHASYLAWVLGT